MIQRGVVDDHGVEFVVLFKGAHLAEEASAAQGAQIEGLIHRQGLDLLIQQPPTELGGADGRRHGGKQIFALTAGDVGGQRHVEAAVQIFGDRRHAAGQVGV